MGRLDTSYFKGKMISWDIYILSRQLGKEANLDYGFYKQSCLSERRLARQSCFPFSCYEACYQYNDRPSYIIYYLIEQPFRTFLFTTFCLNHSCKILMNVIQHNDVIYLKRKKKNN